MISKKDIEHIAKLARIETDEAERQKLAEDLPEILDFVEKLKELDTTNTSPVSGGGELKDVIRPDQQVSEALENKTEEVLGQAPSRQENWVKVKAVFE